MQIKKGNSYSLAAVCDTHYFFYHDNVAHVKDLKISQFYLTYHHISLPQSPKAFKNSLEFRTAVFVEITRNKTLENGRRVRKWIWQVDILFDFWSLSEHLDTKHEVLCLSSLRFLNQTGHCYCYDNR